MYTSTGVEFIALYKSYASKHGTYSPLYTRNASSMRSFVYDKNNLYYKAGEYDSLYGDAIQQ
ncbi:MAG: hypothetical protein NVS2B12_03550 [Ktedonobacteraceae bacterium]